MSIVNTHHSEWAGNTANETKLVKVDHQSIVANIFKKLNEALTRGFRVSVLPVTAESGNILAQRIPGHPLHVALMVI